MNKLTAPRKEKVKQFIRLSETSEKVALEIMKAADYDVEAGLEIYFAQSAGQGRAAGSVDSKAIQTLFEQYKDANNEKMMLAEGVMRFCEARLLMPESTQDIAVDPSDVVMIVLSYNFSAATMCEYSQEEFTRGMQRIRCDSLQKVKDAIPGLRKQLADEATFRQIYEYTFGWAKEKDIKSLNIESALAMWQLLLVGRWPLAETWVEFMQTTGTKYVTKDLWNQLFDFMQAIKPDLSNYDPEGAWPSLVDDFVDFLKAKK